MFLRIAALLHMTKKQFLLFCGGGLALVVIVTAFWVFRLCAAPAESAEASAPTPQDVRSDMVYVDLPRLTVSLGNTGTRNMQVDLSLEVAREDAYVLEGYEPQITDKLNVFFSKLPPEKMGAAGSQADLRKEILLQIGKIKVPVTVHDLLIRQLLIR